MYEKGRVEALSDGIFAIIMTILVLEVPIPSDFQSKELFSFVSSILIFGISFLILGNFWRKHFFIFRLTNLISGKTITLNFLFLLVISIYPMMLKWILEDLSNSIPALSYTALYIIISTILNILISQVIHETDNKKVKEKLDALLRERQENSRGHCLQRSGRYIVMAVIMIIPFILSFFFPLISNILLVAVPLFFSLLDNDDRFLQEH